MRVERVDKSKSEIFHPFRSLSEFVVHKFSAAYTWSQKPIYSASLYVQLPYFKLRKLLHQACTCARRKLDRELCLMCTVYLWKSETSSLPNALKLLRITGNSLIVGLLLFVSSSYIFLIHCMNSCQKSICLLEISCKRAFQTQLNIRCKKSFKPKTTQL